MRTKASANLTDRLQMKLKKTSSNLHLVWNTYKKKKLIEKWKNLFLQ